MLPETVGGVFSVDVTDEFSNDLCVGLRLEHETFGCQKLLDILVVGDDTIVDHYELVVLPRPVRVAVEVRWSPVGCPSGVGHTDMLGVDPIKVQILGTSEDLVLQLLHLTGGFHQLEQRVIVKRGLWS